MRSHTLGFEADVNSGNRTPARGVRFFFPRIGSRPRSRFRATGTAGGRALRAPEGRGGSQGPAASAGRIPPEDPADQTRALPGPAPPLRRLRGAGRVGTARAPAVRVAVTRAAFCVYTQNAAAKRRLGSSGARPSAPAPGLAGSRRQVRAEARCSPLPCANQAQPEALASGFFPRKRGKKFFARAARRADKEVRDPARRFA